MGAASYLERPDTPEEEPSSFRVAIIGGGIGGLSLALTLNKHAHIQYDVYEACPKFQEIGAGVSVGPNARQALELIGSQANKAFTDNLTGNMWESRRDIWSEYIIVREEKSSTHHFHTSC